MEIEHRSRANKMSKIINLASKRKKRTYVSIVFLQMIRFHGKPHILRETTNSCNDFQCLTSDWLRKLLTPQTLYKKSPATFQGLFGKTTKITCRRRRLCSSHLKLLFYQDRGAFFPSLTWKGQKLTPRHDLGKQTFEKKVSCISKGCSTLFWKNLQSFLRR